MATTEVIPAFSFEITGITKEKVLCFTRTHECSLDAEKEVLIESGNLHAARAIGPGFTFSFTPTNLITITVVRCRRGKEEDVTDYDSI